MNKAIKTILISERSEETRFCRMVLIISIAVFAGGLALVSPVQAQSQKTNEIKVEICNDDWSICERLCTDDKCTDSLTLFKNVDFLPGDTVERRVRITNKEITPDNPGKAYPIAIEAINVSNPFLGWPFVSDKFGDILNFTVEEKAGAIKYEETLSKFFKESEENDEIVIAELGNNARQEFIFSVYFYETGDDRYQKKSLGFDIIFGLKGDEGGTPPGGGGGGVILPPGLTIEHEKSVCASDVDAIINWLTSYKSTSRVVFGTATGTFNLYSAPNYGYASSTIEQDNTAPISVNGVTSHRVNITKLATSTTYYFRAISHASPPTISQERSFTTLTSGEKGSCCETEKKEEAPPEPGAPELTGGSEGEIAFEPSFPSKSSGETTPAEESQESVQEPVGEGVSEGEAETPGAKRELSSLLSRGLASIGGFFLGNIANLLTTCLDCFSWWLLVILAFIALARLITISRKKDGETDALRKKYLKKLTDLWGAYLAIIVIALIWLLSAGKYCLLAWPFLIALLITFLLILFDRKITQKAFGKPQETIVTVVEIISIIMLLAIWVLFKCLSLWVILALILINIVVRLFSGRN